MDKTLLDVFESFKSSQDSNPTLTSTRCTLLGLNWLTTHVRTEKSYDALIKKLDEKMVLVNGEKLAFSKILETEAMRLYTKHGMHVMAHVIDMLSQGLRAVSVSDLPDGSDHDDLIDMRNKQFQAFPLLIPLALGDLITYTKEKKQ